MTERRVATEAGAANFGVVVSVRGTIFEDTGGPLQAPVGKPILSRVLDVFGDTIDHELLAMFRAPA